MTDKYGVGTKHITNEGYEIEIVEKLKHPMRRVRFGNGYEAITRCPAIKEGNIKNPYHRSVFGVGYFGVGGYKSRIDGKTTQEYETWKDMLRRCYNEKRQEKFPTYKLVTVCEDWHSFQNFAKWYEENNPKMDSIKFQLDKDLLQEDVEDKIYSPDTCVFLPHNVNGFLTNKKTCNSPGYTGVRWDKTKKKWRANINLFEEGKVKNLGRFSTPEEASFTYQEARAEQAEKAKDYLRSLNYLSEEIIQLVK